MTESPTASAIIDAAEAEFAAAGIEHGSLRAIMRAAGTDPGSIHYHFGTREAVAEHVLDRILVPLNNRRLELLTAASERSDDQVPLPQLLNALVRPDVEACAALEGRGHGRGRLIGAIYIRPSLFVEALVEDRFRPVAEQFMPHLVSAVPHLPPQVMSWRVRWAVFGMVGAVLSDDKPIPASTDELIQRIVTTASGALSAPIDQEEHQ